MAQLSAGKKGALTHNSGNLSDNKKKDEAEAAYKKAGIDFAKHAVAVTGAGSELEKHAIAQGWMNRFPMWDWVGGRTSVMSAVGTLAAALQGVDVRQFLAGAAAMDVETRSRPAAENAAMLLALMWHHAGGGKGLKDMVVLPYKDRLVLFSKYLQQLVMESLGKEHDLDGKVVNQGIAVYGNKGSTDQHAYVQQLRDGVNNFFATFIEVGKSRSGASMEVDPGFTSGDYLQGFLRGTRKALAESGRESITLHISEVDAFHLGLLVGLFERAVSFYASLVNVNAMVAGLLASTGLFPQYALAFNKGAFEAKNIADALKALGAGAPTESKDVTIGGPDIAENGAVVPLTASTKLAGVKQLLILVEKNPSVLIAAFNVTPAVEANFATRAKMGQSSDVYAVAITNDGKALFAKKEVKVTLGGCGG